MCVSARKTSTLSPSVGVEITLIFKAPGQRNLDTYRNITILRTICKIRTAILIDRILCASNLLYSDCQCTYDRKINTCCNILYRPNLTGDKIPGYLVLSSKRCGWSNRDRLWRARYGKGLPFKTICLIVAGSQEKTLLGWISRKVGAELENERGLPRRIPIIELIY